MKLANEKIDETGEQIRKIGKKADHLNERLDKANKDLAEILKNVIFQ